MKLTVLLLVCGLLSVNAAHIESDYYPFENEIYAVNSANIGWVAGRQKRFEGRTEEYVAGLCGVKKGIPLPLNDNLTVLEDIPDSFDSRTQWPNCKSIGLIEDQSDCGSCWAFGAVEAMSDRYCIHLKMDLLISAANLMECCHQCGGGCGGGFLEAAWRYWVSDGIVTGGLYDSSATEADTCQPYPLPSCEHHINGSRPACPSKIAHTPKCVRACHAGYPTAYDRDLHYGASAYSVGSDVARIQTEIMTNGPVEGGFTVYADFPSYKSGVYKRTSRRVLGGHAIKIIGWGEENSMPYWLIANSWNPDWGDKGYFKILRGVDECGIESQVNAGMPKS